MLGAICIQLNDVYQAKIYLAGTFNDIDWSCGCENTNLGVGYKSYDYFDVKRRPAMVIMKGLDGNYILRLIETKRYILKIENRNDIKAEISLFPNEDGRFLRFQNESNKFLYLDWDSSSVTFQFVNYLGRSKISFVELAKELIFEVIPDKINYEDDYISLTEAIADECAELLLDYSGPTSNVFTQSDSDKKTILEQFIFLRKLCYGENLHGIFEMIKRNPDRVLSSENELKPLGTGVPSQKFYQTPFSYSRGWEKVSVPEIGSNNYLPQIVSMTRKYDQYDTPANRFVKYALQIFDTICEDLISSLMDDEQGRQAECIKEAKAIRESIDTIFRDPFFGDVGSLEVMPQNNQVLQKRQGYLQIFTAYSMLDLALKLDWKGKDKVYEGESKNVALLYEYWLFFELYKIISSIEGCVSHCSNIDSILDFSNGVTVSLKEGDEKYQAFEIENRNIKINLYYNRTFGHKEYKATRYEGSYSRAFRPDYTLAIFPNYYKEGLYNGEEKALLDGAVSYIHFDAKYRITDLTALFDITGQESIEEELDEEKIDSVVNTYKRGDLLKMHTYNNAIRRTVGSYVIYPGANNADDHREPFHIYDEILPGVGAFALKPSNSDYGERIIRSFILDTIRIWSDDYSTFNRFRHYSEMILKANTNANDDERLLKSDSSK